MDSTKYIRPFNTKAELFKKYGYKDLTKQDRDYIKTLDDKQFTKYLDEATFFDCFDIGYFTYVMHKYIK